MRRQPQALGAQQVGIGLWLTVFNLLGGDEHRRLRQTAGLAASTGHWHRTGGDDRPRDAERVQALQQRDGARQRANAVGILRFHLLQQLELALNFRFAFARHKVAQRSNGLFTVNEVQHRLRIDAAALGPVRPGTLYRRQRIHQGAIKIEQKTLTLHRKPLLNQALMICAISTALK